MNTLTPIHIALAYAVAVNVLAFVLYGADKWKARHSRWRVPEATLLVVAIVGGSVGAWLGMCVWHHKTLHKKFRYGVPLILTAQIALFFLCSCKTVPVSPVKTNPTGKESPATAEHSPSVLIVMYDPEAGKEQLLKAINACKAEIIYDYNIIPGMAIRKPDDKTLEETMRYFRAVNGVVSVDYDHIYRLTDPVKPRLEVK